jgi:hypothetical protein
VGVAIGDEYRQCHQGRRRQRNVISGNNQFGVRIVDDGTSATACRTTSSVSTRPGRSAAATAPDGFA